MRTLEQHPRHVLGNRVTMALTIKGKNMPLTLTFEKFAAIRAKVMRRKIEVLAAEITLTDWNDQPQFSNVDDFLKFADAFIEPSENDPTRSRRRP
jgi:hypothetical protein